MAQRFSSKTILLAAVAVAAVLAAVGLTQGWFGTAGSGDHQGLRPESKTGHDDGGEAVADLNWLQAEVSGSNTTRFDGRSEGNRKAPVQLLDEEEASLETVLHQDSHLGEETKGASPAIGPLETLKLVAGNTTVKQTEHGPIASFQFRPTTTKPVGPVLIVAFLPPGSDAQILDLSPTGGTAYSGIDRRTSENGWFAAFQGTPENITDLGFHLSVSQPVTATIKGNCGIEPFEIDLRATK